MAALGATLGVLLFVSLVVIGVLIYLMRKGKADWKKIYEVSVFRSAVSSKIKAQTFVKVLSKAKHGGKKPPDLSPFLF